jgi:Tfp pilus assembly protein PilP
MNKFKTAALIILLPAMLISCGEKPQEKSAPIKKIEPKPQALATAGEKIDVSAQIELTVKAKKRNPFANYVVSIKGPEKPKVKGPLECCDIPVFKLLAVVISPDKTFALLQSPDNKRYIVRKGDVIGTRDGKIVKFSQRSITIKELVPEEPGRPATAIETELKLPLEPEMKK